MNLNLDKWIKPAELLDHGQQEEDRVLICTDGHLAVPKPADLAHRMPRIVPQIKDLLRVIEQHPPRISKCPVLRRAVKKLLADVILEPPYRLADRRLCPAQDLRSARKAPFTSDSD